MGIKEAIIPCNQTIIFWTLGWNEKDLEMMWLTVCYLYTPGVDVTPYQYCVGKVNCNFNWIILLSVIITIIVLSIFYFVFITIYVILLFNWSFINIVAEM